MQGAHSQRAVQAAAWVIALGCVTATALATEIDSRRWSAVIGLTPSQSDLRSAGIEASVSSERGRDSSERRPPLLPPPLLPPPMLSLVSCGGVECCGCGVTSEC